VFRRQLRYDAQAREATAAATPSSPATTAPARP
jgi:hypothetical protein